jgi:hypothetical protein
VVAQAAIVHLQEAITLLRDALGLPRRREDDDEDEDEDDD